MRAVNYIALAIPVFFALIGVEWLWARWRKERLYRLNDSVADLGTGVLDQVLGVFLKALTVGAYALVWERYRVTEWPATAGWTWVLCFLGVDFFYYWFHRVSHESNLPWGAHIVHHSSEEYNLSVALRQGAFQPLFSFPFYLPLAWLGFPPLVFLACASFDTLYQFWIHTRAIGRLGPLEWILNTPSHHRVHHGCDAKYIDRNYAGTLIIWDRLFGSFQAEEEEPVYGITRPLRSWNPLWANFHHYFDLARASRRAPGWRQAVEVWLRGPGFKPAWLVASRPEGGAPTVLSHGESAKYDRQPARSLLGYALLQFLLAVAGALTLLGGESEFGFGVKVAIAAGVVWTVLDVGLIFDGRAWVVQSELLRLAALGAAAAYWAGGALEGGLFGLFVGANLALCALFAARVLGHRSALIADGSTAAPEPRS